jgi:integrase
LLDDNGERPTRYWVYYHVQRLCREARIEVVSPHGLRGLHATLATVAGGTAHQVAAALGHSSPAITEAAYLDKGVMQAERHRAALTVLAGGQR